MLILAALLIAMQSTVVIPSPPVGMGPYQGKVSPPAPLVLTEVEQEMWDAFGGLWGVMTLTCKSPDVKARLEAAGGRLSALQPRLEVAVDRKRGGRIVRDAMDDAEHTYIPGCPSPEAIDERLSIFEEAVSSLDTALSRAGY